MSSYYYAKTRENEPTARELRDMADDDCGSAEAELPAEGLREERGGLVSRLLAAMPSSSSHASHRSVIQTRSAQSVRMSALMERMNRAPPLGRPISLAVRRPG